MPRNVTHSVANRRSARRPQKYPIDGAAERNPSSSSSAMKESSCPVRNEKDAENECPVCFEQLEKGKTMTLNCNHEFCNTCIGTLIKTKKKELHPQCPLCRDAISDEDTTQALILWKAAAEAKGELYLADSAAREMGRILQEMKAEIRISQGALRGLYDVDVEYGIQAQLELAERRAKLERLISLHDNLLNIENKLEFSPGTLAEEQVRRLKFEIAYMYGNLKDRSHLSNGINRNNALIRRGTNLPVRTWREFLNRTHNSLCGIWRGERPHIGGIKQHKKTKKRKRQKKRSLRNKRKSDHIGTRRRR
jgi:hypothetical protein